MEFRTSTHFERLQNFYYFECKCIHESGNKSNPSVASIKNPALVTLTTHNEEVKESSRKFDLSIIVHMMCVFLLLDLFVHQTLCKSKIVDYI